MHTTFEVRTQGKGLYEFTPAVVRFVRESQVEEGILTLFIQHTSASLLIQENADPSAKRDLHAWLERLVPEHDALFTHTAEGPDDMPAHIKAALTQTFLCIPIIDGALALGTWQGVYVWEHRSSAHHRSIAAMVMVS